MNHLEQYFTLSQKSPTSLKGECAAHNALHKFTDIPAIKLTKAILRKYAEHLADRTDLKHNSKYIYLAKLKPFYDYALDRDLMLIHPFEDFELPKMVRGLPRVISVKDMKRLLCAPDISTKEGLRARTIMELFYSTGFRANELLNLTPDNFMNDYREVRFTGKGSKEAVLPVGKLAAHFTKHYVENIYIDGTLFNIKHTKLSRIVAHYGHEINLKIKMTPHIFRYSIATHLAENGANIRHIQEFLRHDDINTTTRYVLEGLEKLKDIHRSTHPRGAAT